MTFVDVISFTASDVDMLVDFLDGVQHEFGSKPRRDGVVSFQARAKHHSSTELEMAFRRVRRRYVEAQKASKVEPIIEELLKVIEGNGMTIQAWFEAMDQVAINNKVTQEELSVGMRILQDHHTLRKKQPVLTVEKIQELFVYMDANHDGTLELNEIALACNVERYRTTSSEKMTAITLMMRALDDYMAVRYMKIRDLFVHLDKDKSDGLSRAEIKCGFHAIQAEAIRQQEAAARRRRREALRREAREEEARNAEAAREKMRILVERRRLSLDGEAAWIPAPLANRRDPWVGKENGLFFKAARGRTPAQALVVNFRRQGSRLGDGPVYGLIMHPREYFGNVTKRVTKLFEYTGEKYVGFARILHPPVGAFETANAAYSAAPYKPELRFIETDAEWQNILGREFACRSEERLYKISKWHREKLAALSSAETQGQSAKLDFSITEALGEVLEFVSNPDNLWVLTRDTLTAVTLHIRAPRNETDEAPVLAAGILWKLSEYEDFVLPLLKADAVSACSAAVEQLGPPRAGALEHWLQVALQTRVVGLLCRAGCGGSVDSKVRLRVASALIAVVARPWGALEARKEHREGVEGKTLSFASFGLRYLVATSISIRGSIAQRSGLFDALLFAIRPRAAVACAAFCLAHVTTGESAALLTRRKIVAALLTLSGLLDANIDQMEAINQPQPSHDATAHESTPSHGAGLFSGRNRESAGKNTPSLMESTGTALWGCLSHLSEAICEEDSMSKSIVDSCSSDASVGSLNLPDTSSGGADGEGGGGGVCIGAGGQASDISKVRAAVGMSPIRDEGGFDSGDGRPDEPVMPTRKVLSTCALPLLRLLSHAARHHTRVGSGRVSGSTSTSTRNAVEMGERTFGRSEETSKEENVVRNVYDNEIGAVKSTSTDMNPCVVPEPIISIMGSCLSRVAQEIDLAAEPPGAMESVLSLLVPSAGQLVREQVALTLGAIAGQGFQLLTEFRTAEGVPRQSSGAGGGGAGSCIDFDCKGSGDDVTLPQPGEGRRRGKRFILWRQFCAGLVKGSGAQVILDCASPGPASDPNTLLLRERAGRALSLICLCAGSTPASSVMLGGLASLLRCREGEMVAGAATAALWAVCRVQENRRCFAKIRVVSCLTSLCEWSRQQDYQTLHLYCLAALYLLSQEPENALQISNEKGSISKLVMWATPSQAFDDSEGIPHLSCPDDNAKTASCLGLDRLFTRCLLLPEGMRELADGLASYSMLHLVLNLLRVRPRDKSVLPLTLQEAQGILFAVQDRAEYRGYCEQICGGDPFSVEDTLALQLKRHVEATPGAQYADLVGDAVVGLASLSMTLVSRRRLAVNGTLESIGKLLARTMSFESGTGNGDKRKGRKGRREAIRNLMKLLKNLSSVPEAHQRLSGRPLLLFINRLWEESPDEITSKLACHVLANLSRSDVPGVRNRLFQSHLAAESTRMIRGTSVAIDGGSSSGPAPPEQLSTTVHQKQPRDLIATGAATGAHFGSNDSDDESLSISSSLFRRDRVDKRDRLNGVGIAHSASVASSEEMARRDARLDAQYRFRLMPAALWGDRASNFSAAGEGNKGDEEATQIAVHEDQQTFLTAAHGAGTAGMETGSPTTDKRNTSRMKAKPSSVHPGGVREFITSAGEVALPTGATSPQAASMKRPAVTSSVPLRWQSRVVALSSLRDTFTSGTTVRGSPSMGRRMARTRCRAYQCNKERSRTAPIATATCDNKDTAETCGNQDDADEAYKITPAESDRRTSVTNWTSRGVGTALRGDTRGISGSVGPDESSNFKNKDGHGDGKGAGGVFSLAEGTRPSTSLTNTGRKAMARPSGPGSGDVDVGGGEIEPPSVVFEAGFSALRRRRTILDRIYRFTRYQGHNGVSTGCKKGVQEPRPIRSIRQATSNPPGPESSSANIEAGASPISRESTKRGENSTHESVVSNQRKRYPNDLQPWKPPMLFQFSKEPLKVGRASNEETVVLDPTSPATHFVFKPPPHSYVDGQGRVVVEAASSEGLAGKGDDRMRLDRFQHVPGCLVCLGSVGHGMDGRLYHHYTSSDRMRYMPEHPGPYPPPAEPPSLERLGIQPPKPEPPKSPASGQVVLPFPEELTESDQPNAPPLPRHYMEMSREACSRCHQGGKCPGQGACPVMGVVPVESAVLLVDEPRLRDDFDDLGEAVMAESGRAWSVERSSIFSQRKRQCESQAVFNTEKVKRKRFETSFGRASKLQRFPRFVAEGNRDIIIKKTSVKQEVALVRETLWVHYDTLLSSYSYYAALDGVFGEPDSSAYQLGRDQYEAFLADILHAREKENKIVYDEVRKVFIIVNVEEESSSVAGLANLDRRLCEQEWMECMVRIGAALYRKETNNGSVARALSRFMAELAQRLPKGALLDADTYRKEKLYKEGVEKVLTRRIEGFRALFQTYPINNLAMKAARRRLQVPKEELLRFSLTDWEVLMDDSGVFRSLEREKVKIVFLQSRMLVTDELVDRTKNCCLTPVDFLEAVVRLADAMPAEAGVWPTTEESFE
ncbi:unnamed protein product, partial [Scytosiphon promiscuus]